MRSPARLAGPGPVRLDFEPHLLAAGWRPNAPEQHREVRRGDSGEPVRPPRVAGTRGRRTRPATWWSPQGP
eukprot:5914233-Alexandrium_andersonii.AAC.1